LTRRLKENSKNNNKPYFKLRANKKKKYLKLIFRNNNKRIKYEMRLFLRALHKRLFLGAFRMELLYNGVLPIKDKSSINL
jgi:hypothetical protein